MFQSKKTNNSISSILGPELKIDGDIKSKGDLLIYGEVAGNVISDGTINSAKGSVVQGNINAKNASIHGTVKGDLTIQHKVIPMQLKVLVLLSPNHSSVYSLDF